METFDRDAQHKRLNRLRPYIKPRPITHDAYGDPMIKGRTGYIYATPEGYQIVCLCDDGYAWAGIKRRMGRIARVTQDGDGEGVLMLRRHKLSLAESEALAMAIDL